jgi:hypothetical protein
MNRESEAGTKYILTSNKGHDAGGEKSVFSNQFSVISFQF